eukprot:XP_011619598.1 PREDICTED: perilipin-2-like [Takifugu rubripes]
MEFLARSLTQQLQTTCLVLVSSLQGLPTHLQQEVLSVSHSASHAYLSRAERAAQRCAERQPGPSGAGQGVLDEVMEYMVNNTPLIWLVGPFHPHMVAVETLAVSPQDRPVAPPPPGVCVCGLLRKPPDQATWFLPSSSRVKENKSFQEKESFN